VNNPFSLATALQNRTLMSGCRFEASRPQRIVQSITPPHPPAERAAPCAPVLHYPPSEERYSRLDLWRAAVRGDENSQREGESLFMGPEDEKTKGSRVRIDAGFSQKANRKRDEPEAPVDQEAPRTNRSTQSGLPNGKPPMAAQSKTLR